MVSPLSWLYSIVARTGNRCGGKTRQTYEQVRSTILPRLTVVCSNKVPGSTTPHNQLQTSQIVPASVILEALFQRIGIVLFTIQDLRV